MKLQISIVGKILAISPHNLLLGGRETRLRKRRFFWAKIFINGSAGRGTRGRSRGTRSYRWLFSRACRHLDSRYKFTLASLPIPPTAPAEVTDCLRSERAAARDAGSALSVEHVKLRWYESHVPLGRSEKRVCEEPSRGAVNRSRINHPKPCLRSYKLCHYLTETGSATVASFSNPVSYTVSGIN